MIPETKPQRLPHARLTCQGKLPALRWPTAKAETLRTRHPKPDKQPRLAASRHAEDVLRFCAVVGDRVPVIRRHRRAPLRAVGNTGDTRRFHEAESKVPSGELPLRQLPNIILSGI